jgi:AraC-like DNA-binding protein
MLTVQTASPQTVLRPFIRAYVHRMAQLGREELVEPVIARLGVMLEFEFEGAYEVRNYGSNAPDQAFPITIIGPQTWRRARLIIRGYVESLVVMFQPTGFHALFGIPTAPLSEAGTEGHSVLGRSVSALHEQLGNLRTFAQQVELLDRYFLHRFNDKMALDPVNKALNLLTRSGPLVRVDEVARHMGTNRRYLERKALAYSGVSPNSLTRISRFSRALRLRTKTSETWTQIAQSAGYHDHMHMIRDFREFAGGAPTSALQEIAPDHLIHFAHSETSGID